MWLGLSYFLELLPLWHDTQEGDGPLGQAPQQSPQPGQVRGDWAAPGTVWQPSSRPAGAPARCLSSHRPQAQENTATRSPRVGAPSSEPKLPSLRVFTIQCRALVVWAIWKECPEQDSVTTCPRGRPTPRPPAPQAAPETSRSVPGGLTAARGCGDSHSPSQALARRTAADSGDSQRRTKEGMRFAPQTGTWGHLAVQCPRAQPRTQGDFPISNRCPDHPHLLLLVVSRCARSQSHRMAEGPARPIRSVPQKCRPWPETHLLLQGGQSLLHGARTLQTVHFQQVHHGVHPGRMRS